MIGSVRLPFVDHAAMTLHTDTVLCESDDNVTADFAGRQTAAHKKK